MVSDTEQDAGGYDRIAINSTFKYIDSMARNHRDRRMARDFINVRSTSK